MNWTSRLGLWRSIIMYYWKPFNQRRLRRFYRQFVAPGDLCFDIGAHLGNRSLAWLALGAKVVALEPQPVCIHFLNKKFRRNDHFILDERAVGAEPGTLPMFISQNAPTVSSLSDQDWREALNDRSNFEVKWEERLEVEVTTLDQLIRQYGVPTFCKIDVEDFEEAVLRGLSTPIKTLSFEFFNWTPQRTQACLELLVKLGHYEFNWSIGEQLRLRSDQWLSAALLVEQIQLHKSRRPFSGDIYAQIKTM